MMGNALVDRRFQVLPHVIQVYLEHGDTPTDIVPILSDAARLAREKHLQNLLVVSGLGDPATAEAVSTALQEMQVLGTPPSRIAFVAYMFPQYSVYHFAEHYAQKFGIEAKVHVSIRDAMDWLGVREETLQAPPPA